MSAIVVAGGATGIGASVVRALRSRGDSVVLVDINRPSGEAVAAEAAPGPCWFVEADFTEPTNAVLALKDAADILGGVMDVLFCNAGYLLARPLAEWSIEDWRRSEAVNLQSPFFMVQAAVPYLRKSSRGRVILTSSTGGLRGHAGMPAYHATKAGVIGLVRSLADELGPAGITVNALCPGWVDTPFNDEYWDYQTDPAAAVQALEASIPLRRQGTPDEVAKTVLFLIDEASSYVTGQALVVDGGYTAV
jgi:dihydroanticapsin dehydrogenase